jgi:hypothetical protein
MNHDLYVGSKFCMPIDLFWQIKFNFPYEYLQQIEGFIGTAHGRGGQLVRAAV